RLGFNTQLVVAVMLVLPALAALPAVRLKLTALAERPTVSDSGKVAVSAIGSALELSCAEATDDEPTSARTSRATRVINLVAGFMKFSFFFLNFPEKHRRQGGGWFSSNPCRHHLDFIVQAPNYGVAWAWMFSVPV